MTTTPTPPDWATLIEQAAKDDPAWFDQLAAAVTAVRDAKRVAKDARAEEQTAAQRKVNAEQAIEQHTAALRDALIEKGGQ